jgi:hypothetical protein
MKITKYCVHDERNIVRTYVTTTRNREDMIQQIRDIHDSPVDRYFKISVVENGIREFVYIKQKTLPDLRWTSLLDKAFIRTLP